MSLHEHDKIPWHFRSFSIASGRVTFRVEGEFEVDLTIADEDPESQFWFIDFRFLFHPALDEIPDQLRQHIENQVNAALEKDGLLGCYKLLHELVLTQKIAELRKQAIDLSRGRWIDNLHVEPLRRELSIQYWVDRFGFDAPKASKSWIIIGIHSGKRNGRSSRKTTSRIAIRWFRHSKEVKDIEIAMDEVELSVESLLRNVIALHIDHILSSVYEKLLVLPLFANSDLGMVVSTSTVEPTESMLKVQLTSTDTATITIEPVTGRFAFSPASSISWRLEHDLNSTDDPKTKAKMIDPAGFAHESVVALRCLFAYSEIVSRAVSLGWLSVRNIGLKPDELKAILPRDTVQISWFRRSGWVAEWFMAVTIGMSGERWWLIET